MSDIGRLNQVKDPATQATLQRALDRIATLERQLATSLGTVTKPLDTHLDVNGNRVQNLASPAAEDDAVSLKFLRQYVANATPDRLVSNSQFRTPPQVRDGDVWVEESSTGTKMALKAMRQGQVVTLLEMTRGAAFPTGNWP